VTIADGPAEPTLLDQEKSRENAARDAILAAPVVKAAFEAFPDAELVEYSQPEQRSAHA
jgi:DNA polymerase-3 subunit gamma/tau